MAMMAAALAQKEGRERPPRLLIRLRGGGLQEEEEVHARGTEITSAIDEEIQSKSVRSPLLHLLARVLRFSVF